MCHRHARTHAHAHSHGITSQAIKKNEIKCHLQQHGWTWTLSHLSKPDKDKYVITYMWNLKNTTNDYEKEADSQR